MDKKIDVEELKKITAAARAGIEEKKKIDAEDTDRKEKEITERLFNSIIEYLPKKMAEAATRGENSVVVWQMGKIGTYNPEYNIPDVPIDWELFARLQQYCTDNGLMTEKKEVTLHQDYTDYVSYQLIASWPI